NKTGMNNSEGQDQLFTGPGRGSVRASFRCGLGRLRPSLVPLRARTEPRPPENPTRRGKVRRSLGVGFHGESIMPQPTAPDHDQRLKVLLKEFFEAFFLCFFPTWAARFEFLSGNGGSSASSTPTSVCRPWTGSSTPRARTC